MNKKLRGKLLIITGVLLVFVGGALLMLNEQEDQLAGQNAQVLLTKLQQEMTVRAETAVLDTADEEALPAGEMARATLDGYELIGVLRIGTLKMELPILGSWDYDMLKVSPCRYSGSVESGDLILLGHNYKKHFTPLKKIAVGEQVEFCDVNGVSYLYEVTATEILQKTELERLTATDSALTIFTCTNGGYSRFVVRCDRIK